MQDLLKKLEYTPFALATLMIISMISRITFFLLFSDLKLEQALSSYNFLSGIAVSFSIPIILYSFTLNALHGRLIAFLAGLFCCLSPTFLKISSLGFIINLCLLLLLIALTLNALNKKPYALLVIGFLFTFLLKNDLGNILKYQFLLNTENFLNGLFYLLAFTSIFILNRDLRKRALFPYLVIFILPWFAFFRQFSYLEIGAIQLSSITLAATFIVLKYQYTKTSKRLHHQA